MIVHVPAVDWNGIFDDTLRTGRLFRRALPSGRLIIAAQHADRWFVDLPRLRRSAVSIDRDGAS